MDHEDAVAVRLEGSNPACPVRKEVHHMRAARILTGAVLATAAVALPAASAAAAPGDVRVLPDRVHQYQQVDVVVTGCAGRAARGTSDADGPFTLSQEDGPGTLLGHFTVAGWAEPGVHEVTVMCDGQRRTGRFVVAARHQTKQHEDQQGRQGDKHQDSTEAKPQDKTRPSLQPELEEKSQPSLQPKPEEKSQPKSDPKPQENPQKNPQDGRQQLSPGHPHHPRYPKGGSQTGIGGSAGMDTAETTTGAALLTAAAGAGMYMLRRRTSSAKT
ncbi:MAG: hypothetical protein QOI83_4486 [Streptomycetaceae bacterium]|nr:hypothetical protein [Streptomycetaceae bacterium]